MTKKSKKQPKQRRIEETITPEQEQMATQMKRYAVLLLVLLLVLTLRQFYNVYNFSRDTEKQILTELKASITEQVDALTIKLDKEVVDVVDAVAKDINNAVLELSQVDARFQSDLAGNEWMHGLGIAMERDEHIDHIGLWSRNYEIGEAGPVAVPINDDYTEFRFEWYRKTLLEGGRWIEPYASQGRDSVYAEYAVPFWLPNKNPKTDDPSGVVFGNLPFRQIKERINFDNRYVAYYQVLSKQGKIVVHPDEEQVLRDTIFEQAWENEDAELNSMAIAAVRGKSGSVAYTSPRTQEKLWVVHEPLKDQELSIVVFIDKARLQETDPLRHHWFKLVPLLIACATLLSVLIFVTPAKIGGHLVSASIAVSTFLFAGVVGLWLISWTFPMSVNQQALSIVNRNILSDFRKRQVQAVSDTFAEIPKFVRTGVYLQSVEFEGSNNINISAYVWQHYEKDTHKGVSRGFVLPEANSPSVKEVYRELEVSDDSGCMENATQRDCSELVGWHVNASLRQEFDYSLYPLDSQLVWLRFWHEDFRDNVILVPDLDAYSRPNPTSTPGVQDGFVLPGWDIIASWFSVNNQHYNTNFGNSNFNNLGARPQLFFNVDIKREFLNPFVSRIIPLVLVAILMFLLVRISTKSSKQSEWLGFSASSTLAGLSALFFVVGINHSSLRQTLQAANIMYFEYFYFVIYIMLLNVAVSSIRIARKKVTEGHEENLIATIVYWPTLSLVLFIITFWRFY